MEVDQLRKLTDAHLPPFFTGAEILSETDFPNRIRLKLVAIKDPCTFAFKLKATDQERILVRRNHPFQQKGQLGISEKQVIEAFLICLAEIESALGQPFAEDLFTVFHRRVIARAVGGADLQSHVPEVLDHFSALASRSYEGERARAAVGFVPADTSTGVSYSEARKKDFSIVLSNGFDTLLKLNGNGMIVGHEAINPPGSKCRFAPYRMARIASWATDGRFAIVLNQQGDILILKDGQLVFTRRSGSWYSLSTEAFLRQLRRPQDMKVRSAILESALDVSFAKTGGCIGVILGDPKYRKHLSRVLTKVDDRVATGTTIKAKVMKTMTGKQKFQDLDRRLRQKLLSIDGATVLDREGRIIDVGAIVAIKDGSDAGGRKAAAIAVSKLGLGIKISQDGGVTVFQDGSAEPKMKLM